MAITPVIHEYVIDLSSNSNFMYIPAVQGDGHGARYVLITLVSNGMAYTIPSNTKVVVAGTKPDGTQILNEGTVENNKIKFEITYQMSATPGRVNLQIGLIDLNSSTQLKSFPFYLIVTESFDAKNIVSSNEFQLLLEAIRTAENTYAEMQTYAQQCSTASTAANNSAIRASTFASTAQTKATEAANSATAAATSATNAANYANAARQSELNAKQSEINAKASEDYIRNFMSLLDGETLLIL